jgi:hypothetical protein
MNTDNDTLFGSMILAFLIAASFLATTWHIQESRCQIEHDVADCSWQRTPFMPTLSSEGT